VNFEIYLQRLNKEIAVELFLKYDVIVDGSDNFPTRYLVNDAAILTNKPVVFGSIFKFDGQVSVFNYNNGPSYRCLYPNPPKSEDVPNCSEIGVLGVLPGIIGSLQANEVLKLVLGIGEVLSGKLLTYNALNMQQLILSFEKNEDIKITHLENDYEFFCGLLKMSLEITKNELENNLNSYNLLDVREVYERDQYHIGGMHIPLGEINRRKSELPVDKDLVVYCKAGVRSKIAIKKLQEYFPKKLLNLKNGLVNF
jgi:adenylyltransferase/sulfurtransferase